MVGILEWLGWGWKKENPWVTEANSIEAYPIPTNPCLPSEKANLQIQAQCQSHFQAAQAAMQAGDLIKLDAQLKAFPFDEKLSDKLRLETAKQRLFTDAEGWVDEVRSVRKDYQAWLTDTQTLALLAGYLQSHPDQYAAIKSDFHKIAYFIYERLIEAVLVETQAFIENGDIDHQDKVENNLRWIQVNLEKAEKNGVLLKKDKKALIKHAAISDVLIEWSAATYRNTCITHLLNAWAYINELQNIPPGISGTRIRNKKFRAREELNKVMGQITSMGKDLIETIYEINDERKLTRFLHNELEDKIIKVDRAILEEDYLLAASFINEVLYQIHRRYPQSVAFESDLGKAWLLFNP